MNPDTGSWNLQWATWLIEEFVHCGVRVCCLASGSRSSPLAVAAARHPGLASVVHYDERGAAFYALGVARATGIPALWIATSGSAVANGFPAVVEASAGRVPLVLLTADRPPELRDTGANQTIDQVKLFGSYVRWQTDLPCPTAEIPAAFVRTTADHAVHRARTPPAGPVHLNCMFREPLLPERADEHRPEMVASALTTYAPPSAACDVAAVAHALAGSAKVLLVAGELRTAAEREAVQALAARARWPLLPDVTSGLRLGACAAPRAAYYDQMLLMTSTDALRPDGVLHVGGPITSKRLQQFLERVRPPILAHLRDDPARLDPGHQVTHRAHGDVAQGCRALAQMLPPAQADSWCATWVQATAVIDRAIDEFLSAQPAVSEPAVARAVARHLPAGHGLFLASSMPIRDMDMYGAIDGSVPRVGANRGASGIDGTVATAAGFAAGCEAPVTALLGDLALLHDLNSLALVARCGQPLTLVVINNNGGGIFSFLPVARQRDVFESHFGTPHGLHFESAARMFGLAYARIDRHAAFEGTYQDVLRGGQSMLIEVVTDRAENVRLHDALQTHLRARQAGGGA